MFAVCIMFLEYTKNFSSNVELHITYYLEIKTNN